MSILRIALLSICLTYAPLSTYGQTNTNQVASYSLAYIQQHLQTQPDEDWTWRQWFEYRLADNGADGWYRRFGPLSDFSWTQASLNGRGRRGPDRVQTQGERLHLDTWKDACIDAFGDWLNFERFKTPERPGTTFGAKLAEGTLDTREGRAFSDSIEPVDPVSLHGWIDRFVVDDSFRYGFKLLNENPYYYHSIAFWPRKNGLPAVIATTRCRAMFGTLDPGHPQTSQELLFLVDWETRLTVGYRFYPTAFNESGSRPSLTMKLTRQLEPGIAHGNLLYTSAQFNEHEQVYLVGIVLDRWWRK